jgi:hypothetical protein
MSYEAMRWALSQPVEKSSAKFVLVAMADCVNAEAGDMLCWPSTQHIAEITNQDRKTVLDNMRRLREAGFIHDTGKRRGITGQVAVYLLKTPENGIVSKGPAPAETGESTASNGTEIGTGPENGTVPKTDSNSPVFPVEQSRFSHPTVPKTGHGTRKGTSNGTKKEPGRDAPDLPGVSPELLADFLAVRKAKRAGPLTATAVAGLAREAEKAGLTIAEAIAACCECGWQGFNAGWYADRQNGARPRADIRTATVPSAPGRDPTLAKLDEDAKKAAPIPENIRAQIEVLKGKVLQ